MWQAIPHFLAALPFRENNASLSDKNGTAHAAINEAEKAREYFERSLELDDSHAGTHFQLGKILQSSEELVEALHPYWKVLRLP